MFIVCVCMLFFTIMVQYDDVIVVRCGIMMRNDVIHSNMIMIQLYMITINSD